MHENAIGTIVVDCAVELHRDLGPGLLETVYEVTLARALQRVIPAHKKQVLTYLRLTGLKLGCMLNFGEALMRDGITRVIHGNLDPDPPRLGASVRASETRLMKGIPATERFSHPSIRSGQTDC